MDYEAEINNLKNDVSTLKTDIAVVKDNLPQIKNALDKNTEAFSHLTDTLHGIDVSMVSLNNKIDMQGKDIDSLGIKMDKNYGHLHTKIKNMEQRVDTLDEEGKFNIRTFFNKYLPWIIVVIGFGIACVSNFIKF